ncbi:hypothetical protein DL764_008347 [Monosporascus ibericus]|uniref:AAA+ ATPase domain-containing protein n=1 Tax=Monosporascus ibericus TaxID=155417 RepID=A0A4Q4SZY5_9PEZI|nr:hypothetical protein DL764_008347 [Monosporascus ibericus]
MLSASSPVVYPPSSSPPVVKRARPHYDPKSHRQRLKAGFLIDDDSGDDEDVSTEPASKRQQKGVQPESRQPDSQPPLVPPQNREYPPSSLFQSVSTASVLERLSTRQPQRATRITTCSGRTVEIKQKNRAATVSYERIVAARSKTKEGRAKRSYYGIDIHELVETASKELANKGHAGDSVSDAPIPSVEESRGNRKARKCMLWTEKYRAKNFMDLVGDDLTNRQVLRWLKRWDPLVFPRAAKSKPISRRAGAKQQAEEEKPHRKILMLTGAPGLGKTTLAHVCARQAGYEVMEINASDDRSKEVVRNQIRTALGTETVKTVQHSKPPSGQQQKVARPVCVVVDEVDGVVAGSGASGEGGFIKALMDLITVGEKNASGQAASQQNNRKKGKGDDFRQMRPLILVCNDVYHPSLRPLRQSNLAEVVRVGRPTIDAVVTRLKTVFEKEGIPCEKDAARKLCEAAWGMTSGIDAKRGAESTAEGDLRGVMVVGEWVAGRIRSASLKGTLCLTRQWVEHHIVRDLAHGGGGARGLGRGNTRDIVARIFQEGAGFPKGSVIVAAPSAKTRGEQPQAQLGFSEQQKKYAAERLSHMIETSGDVDRIMTDVISDYPNHEFNDDSFLSKPNQAYEWMYFHDTLSSKIFGGQDWELAPYLSQPVLACHHLFASPMTHGNLGYDRKWGEAEEDEAPPLPFSGPRAAFVAHEAHKENRAMLQAIQSQLSPTLIRSFRSPEDVATDFLPYLIRMLSPDVKPVVVGGSGLGTASVRKDTEKAMVKRAANVMADVGIALQRGKIESDPNLNRGPQWVYRMEPDLDVLATFETSAAVINGTQAPTRYAVRQVLDQELQKTKMLRDSSARQARFRAGNTTGDADFDVTAAAADKENVKPGKGDPPTAGVKKDFFGRVIRTEARPLREQDGNGGDGQRGKAGSETVGKGETKVWVTFNEGLNNAVRKPLSLDELMRGL